jgi:hypothetical protein
MPTSTPPKKPAKKASPRTTAPKTDAVSVADDPKTEYPTFTVQDGSLVLEFSGQKVAYDREGAAVIQRHLSQALGGL